MRIRPFSIVYKYPQLLFECIKQLPVTLYLGTVDRDSGIEILGHRTTNSYKPENNRKNGILHKLMPDGGSFF
jgi:hypothetical protein